MIETPSEKSRQFILEKIRGQSFENILINDIEENSGFKCFVNDENDNDFYDGKEKNDSC